MSVLGNNLDKINDQLDGVNDYLDALTATLIGKSQSYIDEKLEVIEADAEAKLNYIKNLKIVPPLHAQYESALATVALLQPLIELELTDLQSVIDAMTAVLGIITAPYQPAVDFLTEIVPKVAELGENILDIATYQPTIPGVDIPPFDINVELTMDDIITG